MQTQASADVIADLCGPAERRGQKSGAVIMVVVGCCLGILLELLLSQSEHSRNALLVLGYLRQVSIAHKHQVVTASSLQQYPSSLPHLNPIWSPRQA